MKLTYKKYCRTSTVGKGDPTGRLAGFMMVIGEGSSNRIASIWMNADILNSKVRGGKRSP